MDNATLTLIAAPTAFGDMLRATAAQWDKAGSDSMFRSPAICAKSDASKLYVFSFGLVSNDVLPEIQEAAVAYPDVRVVFSYSFEDALNQLDLERAPVALP